MGCTFDVPVWTAVLAGKISIHELERCHGYITSIWNENYPGMIGVQLLLSQPNMPSFLRWRKRDSNQLHQTNLIALVPAQAVFQIWRLAVPFALFQHAFFRSTLRLDELDQASEFYRMDPAQISMLSQDCLIVAHLEITRLTRKPDLGVSDSEAAPSVVPQS